MGTPPGGYVQLILPTITLKKGSNAGDYTHSGDTNFADVDAVNLAYTVTIPIGWKLLVWASGVLYVQTAAVTVFLQLLDTQGSTVLDGGGILPPAVGNGFISALTGVVVGDGNSHTIKLQFKTSTAADAVALSNAGGFVPTMTFLLTPAN